MKASGMDDPKIDDTPPGDRAGAHATTRLDAFRTEVRAFVRERLPAALREKVRLGIEPGKHTFWHPDCRVR